MNTEQISFSIRLPQNRKRKTFLIKPYKELIIDIRQAGDDWWVEYSVEITPNESLFWTVLLIDVAESDQSYYNDIFHYGVKKGLTGFVKQQEERGIDLGGMDFKIKNYSYHSVDSKPIAFEHTLIGLLSRLEKTNRFQKMIIKSENSSSFYKIREIIVDQFKEPYVLTENHLYIESPRNFKETINLKNRVEIIINDIRNKRLTFKVILSPKLYQKRRRYLISVELKDETNRNKITTFSHRITILNDQIREVLEALEHSKYNLGGLDILVIPLYDELKESFIKSNVEFMKWAILNVLLDPRKTEIKEEPYF